MKFNEKPFGVSSWITTHNNNKDFDKTHCIWFKNNFEYKDSSCKIRVAAHNRYKIFINKKRFASGPCDGGRWNAFWDEFDIGHALLEGSNEILVQVLYYPPESFDKNTDGGPLSCVSYYTNGCLLMNSDNTKLRTGIGSWRVSCDNSINWINQKLPSYTCVGPVEECDFKKSPLFDNPNGMWETPKVVGVADSSGFGEHSPFTLRPRPIPYLKEQNKSLHKHMPIKLDDISAMQFEGNTAIVPSGEKRVCELDAGVLTNAYLQTKIKGHGKVTFTYAECYVKLDGHYYIKGVRDDWEKFNILGFKDIVLVDGESYYEPFDWRSFRFVRIEVESYENAIEIELPNMITTDYPMEVKAYFESDADWTKPLWDISITTLKRCMNDKYMDCPYYERMQYILDTRLEALYTYGLSSDSKLAKKALEDFHSTLTPEGMITSRAPTNRHNIIPNFALHFIMMLQEYYMQTGDKISLERYMPTVLAILGWFKNKINHQGLIEAYGYWNFIDWCADWADERGVLVGEPLKVKETGISATNTLMYAAALISAASLLKVLKRFDTADELLVVKDKVNSSVIKHCRGESGLFCEIPNEDIFTQHVQVWAVLAGAVEISDGCKLLATSMKRAEGQCTFVMRFFLLRALEKVGMYHLADELLYPWKKAIELNLSTWPEDFARQRSDCHAWSSLPIYEFTSCVLGIKPSEPGFRRILIKPNILSFTKVQGAMTTPEGMVFVKWKIKNDVFFIECDAPYSIPVVIELPNGFADEFIGGTTYKKEIKIIQ